MKIRQVLLVVAVVGTGVGGAPPVALEHVEGALDAQRAMLRSELVTLKSLLEQ